jgi:hypothetical protein
MKKVLCIILCAVLLSSLMVFAKIQLTPVLMKHANFGNTPLKSVIYTDEVFIGSSMFRQGIDAEGLRDENKTCYLLAYNGNQPVFEKLLIQDLLNSGVIMDTLYVDMYAYSLSNSVGLSDVRMIQDMPLSFTLDLYRLMKTHGAADLGDLFEMTVKANNELFFTWPVSFPLINQRFQKGSSLGRQSGSSADQLAQLPVEFGSPVPDPAQVQAVRELIALCEERGIRVVFVETPKYIRLYESKNYQAIMTEYIALLEECGCEMIISKMTADICGVTPSKLIHQYNFKYENPAYFTDLIHLSYEGRQAFTKAVARYI